MISKSKIKSIFYLLNLKAYFKKLFKKHIYRNILKYKVTPTYSGLFLLHKVSQDLSPFVEIYIDNEQGLIYNMIVKNNLDNKGKGRNEESAQDR